MYACIICDIYKLINNTYMHKGFKENGTAKSVRKPDLFKANTYVSHIFFFFTLPLPVSVIIPSIQTFICIFV